MKLTDLQAGPEYVKMLLLGGSGAGKTVNSMTFPGVKKVMDFDNKISSAAKFYEKDKAMLESIDVSQYGKMPIVGDTKMSRPSRMGGFLGELKSIYAIQNAKQKLPFETLIVDTITTLTDSILEDYRYVSQLGVKRPNPDQNSQSDYGLLATHFKQILTGILALDCNVVVIGHTELMKDDESGMITNEILMPGKMASKLGIYFEEVYFAKVVNDKHVWQTKSDTKTKFCRTQRRLPPEIPAHYSEIVKAR